MASQSSLGNIAFMMGCFKDAHDFKIPQLDEGINKKYVFEPPPRNQAWRGDLPRYLEVRSPVFGVSFGAKRKRGSRWVLGSNIDEVDFLVAENNRYGVSRKCLSIDFITDPGGKPVLRVTNESDNVRLYVRHGFSTSNAIYLSKGDQDEIHGPVTVYHPKFSFRLWPPIRTHHEQEWFIWNVRQMDDLAIDESLEYWPRLDSGLSTVDEASRVSFDGTVYTKVPGLKVSQGTYGTVFIVKRVGPDSSTLCAKEMISWDALGKSSDIKRQREVTRKEFESYSRFSHPHLALAVDIAYMQDGSASPWLILEHIPFSLAEYIYQYPEQNPWPEGPLPPLDPADILLQLFSFVTFLHNQGAVHRDLSPNNIRLYPDKKRWVAKVIDLGMLESVRPIIQMCGTPGFTAPEVLEYQPQNEKVDIFSLGMIAFYLLTGLSIRSTAAITPESQVRQMRQKVLPQLRRADPKFQPLLGGLLAYEAENRWSGQQAINYLWRLHNGPGPSCPKREASPAASHDTKKHKMNEEISGRSQTSTIRAPQAASGYSPSSASFETAQEQAQQAQGSLTSVPATPFLADFETDSGNDCAPVDEAERPVDAAERPMDAMERAAVFCNKPDDEKDWDFSFNLKGWWLARPSGHPPNASSYSDGSAAELDDRHLGPSWVTGVEPETEFLAVDRPRAGRTLDTEGVQLWGQTYASTDETDSDAETEIMSTTSLQGRPILDEFEGPHNKADVQPGTTSRSQGTSFSEAISLDGIMSVPSSTDDEQPTPLFLSYNSSCHGNQSLDLKERQRARDFEESDRLAESFGARPTYPRHKRPS